MPQLRNPRSDRTAFPLFWALRGGGGSFGVVTALEFQLYPITEVYTGVLFFLIERGTEVLRAWRRWVEDVPDEVTSVGRFLQFPPIPDIPEPLRGGSFVVVEATSLLGETATDELLAPLRELGPAIDIFATTPVERLSSLHMDPEHPVSGVGAGCCSGTSPRRQSTQSSKPRAPVPARRFSPWRCVTSVALGRMEPGHGALATIEAGFAMFAVGISMTPEMGAAVRAHVEVVQAALASWDAGCDYLNFTERRERGERLFGGSAYQRLQTVKGKVDPEDVFRSNHPVRLPGPRLRKAA